MTDARDAEDAKGNARKENRLWAVCLGALVVSFAVLTVDLLTLQVIFKWDAWYIFWPWFQCLASSIEQGRLPLWDPRPCCGVPFHADPQTGTFYPVYLLMAMLFGGGYGVYQAIWLLHWLLGAVGLFFLARRMGLSPGGSLIGSIVFACNGFFVGQASHTICVINISYVPWVLLLLDRAHAETVWFAAPAGVLFGLSGLAGHPGLTIYAAVMITVWCLLKYRPIPKALVAVGLALVVGAAVLSPAFVSFLVEGQGYTDRTGYLPVEYATSSNRFPFDAIISLLTPALTVAYPDLFGALPEHVAILNGYTGILGALAMVVFVLRTDLRTEWAWLLIFMLIVFLFTLGTSGGLRVIGYYLFPPLRYTRHASFARVFWMLGAALLAGQLYSAFVRASEEDRSDLLDLSVKITAVFLYIAACALLWAWLGADRALITESAFATVAFVPNSFRTAANHVAIQGGVVLAWLAALYALRTSKAAKALAYVLPALVLVDGAAHLYTNRFTVSWNGKGVAVSEEFRQMASDTKGMPTDPLAKRISKHSTFNRWPFDGESYIRTFIALTSDHYRVLVGEDTPRPTETKFLSVLENCPRFWLTPGVHSCALNEKEALRTLRDTNDSGPVPVYVHSSSARESSAHVEDVTPGAFGNVRILRYRAEEVVLQVSAPQDCWLFSTERYAAGWLARVDGREAPLSKANFCFRIVPVPKGDHLVRMHYRPWVYKPLLIMSWGLCLAVAVSWGVLAALRRPAGSDSAGS
ncbi:MAG: YfhO family protein [Thermodesulfobacteriota bacterium]